MLRVLCAWAISCLSTVAREGAAPALPLLLNFLGGIQFPRFVFQHHWNAVADPECQPVGLADEFLLGFAVQQRPLAHRAHQDVKQS